MDPSMIILIKTGYGGLLILAMAALIRAIMVSAKLKNENNDFNKLLRVVLIAIIYLSILQTYQCIDMINNKLGKSWWIPFFCKHGALWFYHITISFIKFKSTSNDDCIDTINHPTNINTNSGDYTHA